MDIGKAFEVAFKRKKEMNWEKIYVVVDIHDTILRACYENEETFDYYPYAREALQLMTSRDDICMILWSGCYDEQMAASVSTMPMRTRKLERRVSRTSR